VRQETGSPVRRPNCDGPEMGARQRVSEEELVRWIRQSPLELSSWGLIGSGQ
jgi:hypothetical protein